MFGLTALELARVQFGFTISFHIVFPAITIGLASYLAVLEALWLWSNDTVYRDLYHFWSKIFAVNFAMGVVSGVILSYQFGANWSQFSVFAGNVVGPLIGYGVLTALFLEATFLGIMLFGGDRVPRWLHLTSAIFTPVDVAPEPPGFQLRMRQPRQRYTSKRAPSAPDPSPCTPPTPAPRR